MTLVEASLVGLVFAAWWYLYERRAYRKARERDRRGE